MVRRKPGVLVCCDPNQVFQILITQLDNALYVEMLVCMFPPLCAIYRLL